MLPSAELSFIRMAHSKPQGVSTSWEYLNILFLKLGGFASKAAQNAPFGANDSPVSCPGFQSAQGWIFVQDRGPKLGMFYSPSHHGEWVRAPL